MTTANANVTQPRRDWSRREVEETVDDYLVMFAAELAGHPDDWRAHQAGLLSSLDRRSAWSLELKYRNISAVLVELGLPYLTALDPRDHYQRLLREVVEERMTVRADLVGPVGLPEVVAPVAEDLLSVFVAPPPTTAAPVEGARGRRGGHRPAKPDYESLARENAALGRRGEEWVVEVERARLRHAGHSNLAAKVEHVAVTQGDGLGFDVLSFEDDAKERHIEVKTTRWGISTPFFITAGELAHSQEEPERFHLYRVFGWPRPRVFTRVGKVESHFRLAPMVYRAVR